MLRRVAPAVLLCVAAAWLLTRAARPGASTPSHAPMLAERPLVSSARAPDLPPASHVVPRPHTSPRVVATTERPTARALEQAHPISEQHERLREQQALIGALNDALDLGDAAALRTLLARYDAVQPEDPMRLAEGYERVADCIETDEAQAAPSSATSPEAEAQDQATRASVRANAQRYYDDARASSVRRYVRRFCLEASGR